MVKALFEQVATPSRLGALGLVPVLDRAAAALNRVDRAAFFTRFEQHHAVQYFYEPFLEAFDPELRKELGVWYTPPEIVEYMVARVDTVLREELDVPDGLADPRVYVLDPCCGTGAYLVEVLDTDRPDPGREGRRRPLGRRRQEGGHGTSLRIRNLARSLRDSAHAVGLAAPEHAPPLGRARTGGSLLDQRPHRLGIPTRHISKCSPCRSWKPSATPPSR